MDKKSSPSTKTDPSQITAMKDGIIKIVPGALVCTMLSWADELLFYDKPGIWITGIVWTILLSITFLLSLGLIKSIRRAYLYYLVLISLYLLMGLIILDSSLRLAVNALKGSGLVYLLICILAILLIYLIQTRSLVIQLRNAKRYNIKSGRFVVNKNEWDLNTPLYFSSPEAEKDKNSRWRVIARFSPLGVALGYALSRNLEGVYEIMAASIILLIIGLSLILVLSNETAIVYQLIEWEKESGHVIELRGLQSG